MSDEGAQRVTGPPAGGQAAEFDRLSAQLAESYAALRKSEERFSLAMQGANDGLWDWDVRTDQVYYSPRWKGMLGYADDEIEPHFSAWERLVHPDDKLVAMKGVEAFLAGEVDKYEIEFRMRHKDSHYVDVLSRAFGVREPPGGPVVRIVGTHVDITERKRAEKEARRQTEYLEALHETTLGLVSRLDVQELLEAIVERAVKLVGAADTFGFLYLVTPEQDRIELRVGVGYDAKYVGMRLERGEGLAGRAWEFGQPVAVDDYQSWPGRSVQFAGEPLGPELGVPLKSGSEVVGVIGLGRPPGAPPFEPDLIHLVSRFANLASIALDNARLHTSLEQRVQERTHELATLNAVAAVVSRSLDLKDILSDALDQTMTTLDMEFGVAYRLVGDPDGPKEQLSLQPLVHRGLSGPYTRTAQPILVQKSKVGAAADCGQPVVWELEESADGSERERLLWAEGGRQGVSIPLLAKGRLVGAMQLLTCRQRTFAPEQLSLMAAVGHQTGVAVENARLYESEQERREEAERRRRVAEGMREMLGVLNSQQSLQVTLDFIVGQACELLSCDASAIEKLETEEGPLRFQSACGLDPELVSNVTFPLDLAVTGQVLRERHPIAVPDTAAHTARVIRDHDWPPSPQRALLQQHVSRFPSLLSVPLVVRDEDYGVLTFYYGEPRSFTEEEVQLAQAIADQAALAIESARLREQAEQTAALAERSRLARELHDSVTQSLYTVTMYTEAAARLLTNGQQAPATKYLRDGRDTALEALREMRLLIFELRPLALEQSGLAGALQARLDAVEKRAGVMAELRVVGVEGLADAEWLPLASQQELYYIALEALNNSLRHARAQHLRICLQLKDTAVRLEVGDDGAGFEPASVMGRGGLGLLGMRERVQRLGGWLEVDSAPGRGTTVRLEIPRGGSTR